MQILGGFLFSPESIFKWAESHPEKDLDIGSPKEDELFDVPFNVPCYSIRLTEWLRRENKERQYVAINTVYPKSSAVKAKARGLEDDQNCRIFIVLCEEEQRTADWETYALIEPPTTNASFVEKVDWLRAQGLEVDPAKVSEISNEMLLDSAGKLVEGAWHTVPNIYHETVRLEKTRNVCMGK